MTGQVLLVEDDPLQRKMISMLLSNKLGYSVTAVENGKKALEYIQSAKVPGIGAILMDVSMPVMDGFETLRYIKTHHAELPVIMLTAKNDVGIAVQAIKDGASDFIIKPPDISQLDISIKNAMKIALLTREVSRLKRDQQSALFFSDLIGHGAGLAETIAYGRKAAQSDLPVFISGETGTGKELFARSIHGESKRAGSPFLAINCGALPENLVESVLFGHEKGAFTGAMVRTIGKFREADGGTIFLDEIGELPLETQVKLLRVLQEKEVEPVGAGHPVKVSVRVISATNRDLKADVKAGRFREDLYFRLNVLPITMPPLRKRKQDIVPLAEHFMQRFAVSDSLPLKKLGESARNYLKDCSWPGNVRELENLIHGALVFFDGDVISRENLMEIHADDKLPTSNTSGVVEKGMAIYLQREDGSFKTLEEIEGEAMQATLKHFEQNIPRAAEALNIAKSTFYRKIKPQD